MANEAFEDFIKKNEMNDNKSKLIQVIQGEKRLFERDLNIALSSGWFIPSGEGMKIFNKTYTILVQRKGTENDKKFI